jgi:prophage maintenance system killer protein
LLARQPVAKKTIHHMDLKTLIGVNKGVVALTKEPHEYSSADRLKLANLVKEVEDRADNQEYVEAIAEKASLLVYDIARGQYFHAGNKRTALVAGLAFLAKNGQKVDVQDPQLVSTVDRAGIAAADLDDVYAVVKKLITKTKAERRGWDKVVKDAVESHRDFLTELGS